MFCVEQTNEEKLLLVVEMATRIMSRLNQDGQPVKWEPSQIPSTKSKNVVCSFANISDDEVLSIRTNIKECRVGALLNKNWKQLSNVGEGYFLESVMICFSPEDISLAKANKAIEILIMMSKWMIRVQKNQQLHLLQLLKQRIYQFIKINQKNSNTRKTELSDSLSRHLNRASKNTKVKTSSQGWNKSKKSDILAEAEEST
ncbi:hypothetical protein GLOIN_2v1843835 [Rhizophagus clarus]|uniref:Uncharacterized protein n=1 Tax=Rhizophagus clarus TaxID=94130 RepID=A0A8H3QL99_9GLOM|nr:hypothetical protein GLOIN_2v1843835 [Rhizophagus clarus]